MADFDLIQTDAQVQSILNDGQNMQGAGAQTTLTTESVLLKDINGNYHKILKSSFTEAIRDTLAGLLVNNDKGTTISQIAAIANSDFGSITPANLASVLGGVTTYSYKVTANTETKCFYGGGIFMLWLNNETENPLVFIASNDNTGEKITKLNTPWFDGGITIIKKNDQWVYITYTDSLTINIKKLI